MLLFLSSSSLCSARSGEGEGLHSAPGQLLVVRQQPVHQSQRQCRVGVRRRLRLQLRVGGRGAAQQEEAARGGQLEIRAGDTWSRQRGERAGWRERSRQSSQGSLAPAPPTLYIRTTPPASLTILSSISG